MGEKPDRCAKCNRICVEKDNFLRGPLEGRYEWLCGPCYRTEGAVTPLRWKAQA